MKTRAAIYYRVSTADQSVDGQLEQLRFYAEKRGFVPEEFIDEGISGAARHRPELDRMIAAVKERKYDVVLVWAFDRFARSTSHIEGVPGHRRRLRVLLPADRHHHPGRQVDTVLAAIAEFERSMISERVKTGMAAAPACSAPPCSTYPVPSSRVRIVIAALMIPGSYHIPILPRVPGSLRQGSLRGASARRVLRMIPRRRWMSRRAPVAGSSSRACAPNSCAPSTFLSFSAAGSTLSYLM